MCTDEISDEERRELKLRCAEVIARACVPEDVAELCIMTEELYEYIMSDKIEVVETVEVTNDE